VYDWLANDRNSGLIGNRVIFFYGLSILLLLGALPRPKNQDVFLLFSFLILFFISAYRGISVGTDTVNYESYFEQLKSGTGWVRDKVEPGWILVNDMVISYGGEFRDVLIISTLLTLIPLFYVAKKYSYNPMLTISLYYLLYMYIYSLNITRQIIAVNIVLVGLVLLSRNRRLIFVLIVFLASLVHVSALIAIPLVFIYKAPSRNLTMVGCVLIAMMLGIFGLEYIYRLVAMTEYGRYLTSYESGNKIGNFAYLLIFNSFFVFILLTIKKTTIEVKLFFAFVLLLNLTMRIPLGGRILMYFSIYQVIFYPYYLRNLRSNDKWMRLVVCLIVIVFSYSFFYRLFGAGEILPYTNVLF
jgi:hypothetical protein